MRSFNVSRVYDRHTRTVAAAVGLLLATLAPALAPAFVSADQVTDRSVALSSSVKAATGVNYAFTFTADNASAGAVVVQFCSNTPLIGEDCTAPTGFTSASATASGGATISGSPTANLVVVTKAIAATENTFSLGNITNPTAVGPLYVRVATYADTTDAADYTANGQTLGTVIDTGSVAVSITDGVSVSGAVLESMTFCVSGETLAANCVGGGASAPALTAPTLQLGQDVSGVIALDSQAVYEGTIYTQLSTNAAKGAVVSLKSNALSCGGLIRSSDPAACDIGPAGTTGDITAGQPKFGLKLGTDVVDGTNGDLVAASANYSDAAFRLNYVSGNATGVTSTYGDPILDTNDAPANNRDMPLKFGASVSNNTPAGSYSANLSLIATGKF